MKHIQLKIIAQSPLAIGRKKPGSVSEAADFIPGSAIRGAIAEILLRSSRQEQEPEIGDDFSRLFVEEEAAIFSNAYPTENDLTVKVLPATAVSAKVKPGFISQKNGKYERYGVFDTLLDRFCAQEHGQLYDPNCPNALREGEDVRVETLGGFYTNQAGTYKTQSVSKRLLTRVGINRSSATSEEEILYSLEVLNEVRGEKKEPTIYQSSIFVDSDHLAAKLINFININGDKFRLGGATSRGLGRAKIAAKSVDLKSNLRERIAEFNEKLKERWQQWHQLFGKFSEVNNQILHKTYFTLDLKSNTILIDNWRRTTVITASILSEFANITDDSLQLHTAYSSYDYLSGWNAAWGLMKDIELITIKGGVYLFSTEQIELWYDILENLEAKGIGERRSEGFGQIEVCHEFHTIFRENAV